MGLFENQLHNQFKFNQNPSEGAFAVFKLLSTMKVVSNLNEQIKTSLDQIANLSEERGSPIGFSGSGIWLI